MKKSFAITFCISIFCWKINTKAPGLSIMISSKNEVSLDVNLFGTEQNICSYMICLFLHIEFNAFLQPHVLDLDLTNACDWALHSIILWQKHWKAFLLVNMRWDCWNCGMFRLDRHSKSTVYDQEPNRKRSFASTGLLSIKASRNRCFVQS